MGFGAFVWQIPEWHDTKTDCIGILLTYYRRRRLMNLDLFQMGDSPSKIRIDIKVRSAWK